MQKRHLPIAGVLLLIFVVTVGLFQNCGSVNVAPMEEASQKICDDSQEYELFTPVEPAILQLQRYRNGKYEYFSGTNLRWWIDNVETNVLPEVPNCERRYEVRVIYNDQCGLEHMQEFEFADPRCEPTTTTTSTTTTTVTMPPPAGNVDQCAVLKANPANVKFQPEGFTEVRKSYGDTFFHLELGGNINEIWKIPDVYEDAVPRLLPIGSYTLATFRRSLGQIITRQQPINGKYITVPFVPVPGLIRRIKALGQQPLYFANSGQNSLQAYDPESIYFTISECPGDFRVPTSAVQPVGDRTMSTLCRHQFHGDGSGTLRYSTIGGGSMCQLEEGKTYYLNFIFQPKDGVFNPARTTCPFDDIEHVIEALRGWGVQGDDETLRRIGRDYQYRCNMNMKHE